MEQNNKIKNAIYIRTSTLEQNPSNQLKDCESLINNEPYEVHEEKQSAWKDKDRPIFELIKNKIKHGEIKSLVVWDWDRLFRNRRKLKEFFESCKLYGCEIHSFRQKFFEDLYKIPEPFDSIMQDLFLNLLGWMAEDESKKKSDRVKIAYQNHKGKKWGRKPVPESAIKEILKKHWVGMDLRSISDEVTYYDKNRNRKNVSLGFVHKTIKENSV